MILMFEDTIGGIPAIRAAPLRYHGAAASDRLFLSRLSVVQGNQRVLANKLARAGLRAILPEADMHGARFDGHHAIRLGRLCEILKRSIDELPAYRGFYERRRITDSRRIGVAGTSMGGLRHARMSCAPRLDCSRSELHGVGLLSGCRADDLSASRQLMMRT